MSDRDLGNVGSYVMVENDHVRVWQNDLEPGESIGPDPSAPSATEALLFGGCRRSKVLHFRILVLMVLRTNGNDPLY